MKWFIYSALLFSCLFNLESPSASAQSGAESRWKGRQMDAAAGIGLIATFAADKARAITPPLAIGADYLLNEKVSIGLRFGYSAAEKKREIMGRDVIWNNSFYTVGLRVGFHYTRISRWDIYGGMMLSQNFSRVSWVDIEKAALIKNLGVQESSSQFAYTAYLGSRYAADKKMSIFAEVGFLNSLLTVGFGYRLF